MSEHAVFVEFGGKQTRIGTAYQQQDGGLTLVLGGTLSPLGGIGPKALNLTTLGDRAHKEGTREVILAVNATVDGQTTAHYVTDLLSAQNIRVTRLAHGVPVGGELDYLDDGTLAAAIRSRTDF